MLLPDTIRPENSIFFNGSIVLGIIQNNNNINMLDLYILTKEASNITYSVFILCLDWLFLINLASMNNKGTVSLCS